MGEENRGSSGGSTALLVVGIVVVVLLIPCCGVVGLFGFGFFLTARSVQQDVIRTENQSRMNFEKAQEEISRSNAEMQEATEKLRNELDSIKLPENLGPATDPPRISDPTTPAAPGSPEAPPGSEEKK